MDRMLPEVPQSVVFLCFGQLASDLLVLRPLRAATRWTHKRGTFLHVRRPQAVLLSFRSVSKAIQPIRYPPAFFNNDPLYSAGRQALMKQYDKAGKLGLRCINPRLTVVKIYFNFHNSRH